MQLRAIEVSIQKRRGIAPGLARKIAHLLGRSRLYKVQVRHDKDTTWQSIGLLAANSEERAIAKGKRLL